MVEDFTSFPLRTRDSGIILLVRVGIGLGLCGTLLLHNLPDNSLDGSRLPRRRSVQNEVRPILEGIL